MSVYLAIMATLTAYVALASGVKKPPTVDDAIRCYGSVAAGRFHTEKTLIPNVPAKMDHEAAYKLQQQLNSRGAENARLVNVALGQKATACKGVPSTTCQKELSPNSNSTRYSGEWHQVITPHPDAAKVWVTVHKPKGGGLTTEQWTIQWVKDIEGDGQCCCTQIFKPSPSPAPLPPSKPAVPWTPTTINKGNIKAY